MIVIFVHLHTHSAYSLLDSISRIENIVKKVKNLNQNAVAITDHGNVFASIKAYKECKKQNIKFIYGCECYICNDIKIKDKNNKYYHLILLAKNEQGRLNLNKLVSLSRLEGFYYKPRIDFELLKKYKEGLIVLSACLAGEIQKYLQNNNYQKAKKIASKYKQEFGDDYYLEFQSHSDIEQLKLARQVIDLAKELKIPYVVTADSHYINKEDQELHSLFVQIGQEREAGETYNDCYIQSEEDIKKILKNTLTDEEIQIAINNTVEIANKCNVQIPLSPPQIPHVDVPKKFKNEEEYLKYLCNKGWKQRNLHKLPPDEQKKYKDRLYYEFNAIKEMGFSGYYLLVYSYANIAKRRGVARGSGGGSLVAYLLNIVDIDPIEYGLYFERFIDVSALDLLRNKQIKPEELKIPDFDLDFGEEDREKVLKFITNKYGEDKVAAIGNFQYIWDKSAIKDIGRVLKIPFETTNKITKIIGDNTIEETIQEGLLDEYIKKYPKLFHYAKQLAGLPRSFSVHPCGKIVAVKDLTYYTAITESDGNTVYQADMYDIEDLGLVKIDTLGLRTVDLIYDILDMIEKDYDYINPKKMNFNDQKVLEVFRKGNTHGVFQFESSGMRETLRKMQVDSLEDIIAANALYRPGAKKYIDTYCNRKHNKEKIDYLHPDIEQILAPTYGVMAYQEQLIEIGRLAKMRNPDLLRKACGKKKPELMAKVEPELKEGLKKRGWTQEQVDKIWNNMVLFGNYSFNKSHSAAYAIIAYIVAFLKTYHPTEFICALFNSYQGKHDKMAGCYEETKRLGVKIKPLSLKNISPLCKVKDNEIIYGIALIKNCNKQIATELIKLNNKDYRSFLDLLIDIKEKTSVNKTQLDALIKLNTFSNFAQNQKLLKFVNFFNEFYNKKQIKKNKIDKLNLNHSIFQKFSRETEKSYMDFQSYDFLQYVWTNLKDKPLPIQEQIKAEIEYLGYPQSTFDVAEDYIIITEIDTKYSPKITAYYLATGKEEQYKVPKRAYNHQPFKKFSILKVGLWEQKNKVKKTEDGFEKIPDVYEKWLTKYYLFKE